MIHNGKQKHNGKFTRRLMLGFALTLGIASNASAIVIDFDSLEVANNSLNFISSGAYTEDGFTISGTPMYYAGQLHINQYAGSAGLHLRSGGATSTTMSSTAATFTLNSIDLSILASYGTSPAVVFTGFLAGGGTVSQSFTPTSFGFTQYNFNSSFSNLTSVQWSQGSSEGFAHQFDNINITVPEPSVLIVLTLGMIGLFLRRKEY